MSKPKTFRPWNPEQTLLLPPSPVEWLPANHLVFFLLDQAAELDLSAIYAVYEARDPRGVKAYEQRMMALLLLYGYCVGIPSSRRIERACWEDAAFRVLTGNQQPDHSRISDFRLVHLDALAGLFVQVLRLCQKAGLVSLGNVVLDGTNVKANASKHKAMSHERMLKTKAQLEAEIAALLRKAELIDAQEVSADNARRREQQARAAEEQAAEAAVQAADAESAAAAEDKGNSDAEGEAAAQALAKEAQQAERRAKAARGRAELARRLAIDKAQAAGLSSPDPLSSVDPLAMPSRNLPTTAAGDPKAKAQRNYRFAGLRLHRSRQPHPQRWGRLDPLLQMLGGGRWRPPDSSWRWRLATRQQTSTTSFPWWSGSWPIPASCPRS